MSQDNIFNFEIRLITAEDIAEILQIEIVSGFKSQSRQAFEQDLANPLALLLIAANANKVFGYISARLITPAIEILNIAVVPASRRKGIGNQLLHTALKLGREKNLTESWLEVRESNSHAQKFYLSHGYQMVGKRRNYYSNPIEDALLMTLIFSDNNPKK